MADVGISSRRKAEVMISEGKVRVNGKVATIGQRVDSDQDQVEYGGQILNPRVEKRYFIVNKPVGVVSTTSDELGRPTVLSLLPEDIQKDKTLRLFPVGRLDIDSSGLLLLTNDGGLTQRLTHPKYEITKTYHVRLDRRPSSLALSRLQKGVRLSDGWAHVQAFSRLKNYHEDQIWFELVVTEGRNRLIRRIWERLGYNVEELIRVAMGPLHLDQLQGKNYQEISPPKL